MNTDTIKPIPFFWLFIGVSLVTFPFVILSCQPDILWLTGHDYKCQQIFKLRYTYRGEQWGLLFFLIQNYISVLSGMWCGILPGYYANKELAVRRVELLTLGFLFGFGVNFYVVDWQTWWIGYGVLWVYCIICPKHPAPEPDPEKSFLSPETKRLIYAFAGAIVLVLGILITIGSYETLSGKLL